MSWQHVDRARYVVATLLAIAALIATAESVHAQNEMTQIVDRYLANPEAQW
jgi:hypothetical protein